MYKQFGLWIEEQAGAQCRQGKGRTDCVINIKHIEPGRFAALYVVDSPTGLGRAVHILEACQASASLAKVSASSTTNKAFILLILLITILFIPF